MIVYSGTSSVVQFIYQLDKHRQCYLRHSFIVFYNVACVLGCCTGADHGSKLVEANAVIKSLGVI